MTLANYLKLFAFSLSSLTIPFTNNDFLTSLSLLRLIKLLTNVGQKDLQKGDMVGEFAKILYPSNNSFNLVRPF